MSLFRNVGKAVLVAVISALPVHAQRVEVKVAKGITAVPKACESIVPANIEGQVDIKALVTEANCKGSGDMLADYTYVLRTLKREKRNKGQFKEETFVYEVFLPTLPSGGRARGVLLVTSRNGVPVPPDELEKERARVGERLEKEEKKAASIPVSQPQTTVDLRKGMSPLGMYSSFGFGDRAVINVRTFLANCEFALIRREQIEGREMLVLTFTPRPDAEFSDKERYISQLEGTIWIDLKDRIVARLAGWPQSEEVATEQVSATQVNDRDPAIYIEMIRLQTGVWLPHVTRINGADHPKLFNGLAFYSNTFSEYKRFTADIKGVELETPPSPR